MIAGTELEAGIAIETAMVMVTGIRVVITAAVAVIKLKTSIIVGTEGVAPVASDKTFAASSGAVLAVTIG